MRQIIMQYRGLKREVYVLFFGKLVTAMGSFVWPMLTFFLTTKLHLSDGAATLLIAVATLVFLPAALFGGKLADRFSRKSIILVFDCLTVSLFLLAAVLPLNMFTALILFFAGLFQTIESPAYDALNADYSTSQQRERAYSLSYLGFNLGYIVGASVAGILFENFIRLAFCINALAVFTSTLLIFFFVHKENVVVDDGETVTENYSEYEQPVDDRIPVLTVLRQRPVLIGMLIVGCVAAMPGNLVGVLLPLQLKEAAGEAGATIYGYLNSLNGFVVIVFTPILTMALKKMTEIPKTAIGLLLFLAGSVLFSLDAAVTVLFVGMFIFTLGEVVTMLGSRPYASRRVPASHRGRVGGISNLTHSICTSLSQFLISFLLVATGSNYRLIWWVFITIGLAAVVLYLLMYGPDKRTFPKLYEKQ